MNVRIHLALAAVTIVSLLCGPAFAGTHIYYTEPGFDDGVRRIDPAIGATSNEFVVNFGGNPDPRGLALDATNGDMYYTLGGGTINRASLVDGSGATTIIASVGGSVPTDVELDLAGGKLYWSVDSPAATAGVRRSNLNGTGVETLVSQVLLDSFVAPAVDPLVTADDVSGIELDLVGGRVYYASGVGLNSIPLSGVSAAADAVNHFTVATGDVTKIAIDFGSSEVYFTDNSGSKVRKRGLGGGAITEISDRGFGRPTGIALDLPEGKVYFGDTSGVSGRGEILAAATDGSDSAAPDVLLSFGSTLYSPFDLELGPIPEPSTAALLVGVALTEFLRSRSRKSIL